MEKRGERGSEAVPGAGAVPTKQRQCPLKEL
jgi:hypothetical protein